MVVSARTQDTGPRHTGLTGHTRRRTLGPGPKDGPEKGLTHYAFLPEQLTEKIEALGYTQIYAEILQWHILHITKVD